MSFKDTSPPPAAASRLSGARRRSPDSFSPSEAQNYETRELAWELGQPRIDACRVRFLIETGADVHAALSLADMTPQQALKNPQLRAVVQNHLGAENRPR